MRVRSFHAPSAQEALLRARAEMGDQARIVTTRATARGVELVVVEGAGDAGTGEIRALKEELRLLREQMSSLAFPIPPGLSDLDKRLTACGVGAELKSRVLAAAAPHKGLTAHEAALNALTEAIPVMPPKTPHADGPRVVALVGPTGVGKTTTIAKLAGRLAAAGRRRVALLTLDTYRVGAVEQLRAYADMLGSPFEAILTPGAAAEAVAKHSNADVILLDTTGRGPFDSERIGCLAETLSTIDRLEVLLVCAATHSDAALRTAVRQFEPSRPTGMVVTKLDETRRIGPVFSLAAEARLPVAFLAAGQEVPADIERAGAVAIAKRILQAGARHDEAAA